MGRGKSNMKFIMKEKVRVLTYHKRKKGLIKKAEEFSILCGVEACVIIYGPKLKDRLEKLEIWPPDHAQVMNIINKYKGKPSDEREKKSFNVSDFLAVRQKKLDDEICKLRKANTDSKFSTWDDRINNFSVNQLWALLARFDSNLEAAKKRIVMLKAKYQCLIADSTSGILAGPDTQVIQQRLNLSNQARFCLFQKNLDLEVTNRQQPALSRLKPFEMNVLSHYPFSSSEAMQRQPFNLNPMDNRTTMMSTNASDFTQVDGESGSTITHTSLSPQPSYDPAAPVLDNAVFSNPWGVPICFYGPFMQPTTPIVQPSMSSFPSQFGELYHNIGDQYGSKN